jgi:predicted RNA-binding Zn-ribbon protein involved in translation (DUF1610 family)
MNGNGEGIQRKAQREASPECPACGANDWVVQENAEAFTLLLMREDRTGGMEVLGYVCGQCGFLRMHSTEALKGNL